MPKLPNALSKLLPLFIALPSIAVLLLLDGNACLFKNVFGVPCPGCGMTRAFLSLMKLDIATGFYYHPLFILPVLIAAVFVFKKKRIGKLIFENNTLWLFVLMVVLSVWVIRMIQLFPDIPPMDIYKNAVFFKIYRFIFKG
jgi:hypothetical protein